MSKKLLTLLIVLLLALVAAAAYYFYAQGQSPVSEPEGVTEIIEDEEVIGDASDSEADTDVDAQIDASSLSYDPAYTIDFDLAVTERILGDDNAPVKISEHSSLTCGHCANFHKNVFKDFKAAWIDSGKAYLVFADFPLNAPALHASMIARCLPEDRYFNFIQHLFEDQNNWAFDAGYMGILKTKSQEYGLPPSQFDTCLKNEDLQKAILNRVRTAQGLWEVNSTPSFVVNNLWTIGGAASLEGFDAKIEESLAKPPPNDDDVPLTNEEAIKRNSTP